MTIYAKVYERDGTTATLRTTYECESAEGVEVVNGIGYGKIVIPHYDNFRQDSGDRIQAGDIVLAWTTAPDDGVHYIAAFLVKTRNYKNGKYEVSGPDFISELQDYVAIAPVGELAEVATTAVSLGTRTIWQTDPDTFEAWEAAYSSRGGITQDITRYVEGKTKYGLLFTTPVAMQVTDSLSYTFADGTLFETTAVAINDRYNYVELADPIPQSIPGAAKIHIKSTRIRVADGSALVEGSPIFYTPTAGPGKPPKGTLVIDRIELGDGDAPDYIYFADPIPHEIAAGTAITQKQYTEPTTDDVAMLLEDSTFGEWEVTRGANTTTGTAYAPNAESVWDALLGICDISGYKVRRALYSSAFAYASNNLFPSRKIEYYKSPHVPDLTPARGNKVRTLGMAMTLSLTYGTMLNLEYEDTNEAITHLVPYGGGGGSGRFDFRTAPIGEVMEDYPTLAAGVLSTPLGAMYYIYSTGSSGHPVWVPQVFSHISPLNPQSAASRREAAEMLLRAACDWLLERTTADTTYRAEIFTIGEPRPGDLIDFEWEGADPTSTSAEDLLISEVRHVVTPDQPYRVTTLTMNSTGSARQTGEQMSARMLLDLQRVVRHSNFGSRGDARVTYDGMEFGGDGDVRSGSGDMTLKSVAGDVNVQASLGDVNIGAQAITIDGPTTVDGSLYVKNDLILPSESSNFDYAVTMIEVRGVPRPRYTKRPRGS